MAQSSSASVGELLAAIIWVTAAIIAVICFINGAIGAVVVTLVVAILLGLLVAAWGPADIRKG